MAGLTQCVLALEVLGWFVDLLDDVDDDEVGGLDEAFG